MSENKIPKVIHYCWFGGNELPESVLKCIESWEKFCSGFEIKQWNESNFDVAINDYVSGAYSAKKWAFVSDYARLHILHEHGGIYLDTDVEVIRPIDALLEHRIFMGLENADSINSGLGMGSVKKQRILKELLNIYDQQRFVDEAGNLNLTTCVEYTTKYMERKGFVKKDVIQSIDEMVIYPTEYFCPKKLGSRKINATQKTFSIHHYDSSWYEESGIKKEIKYRLIPIKRFIRKVFKSLRCENIYEFFKKVANKKKK